MRKAGEDRLERIACALHRSLLRLYPSAFYAEFGEEMGQVFRKGLEAAQSRGRKAAQGYLLREFIQLPGAIGRERLQGVGRGSDPLRINLGFFILGYLFLAVAGPANAWIALILSGFLVSAAATWFTDPHRRWRTALLGTAGFFLAHHASQGMGQLLQAGVGGSEAGGWRILLHFLPHLTAGMLYGLFLGAGAGNLHRLARYLLISGAGFLAGFALNRFAAALAQSFILQSPSQQIHTLPGDWIWFSLLPLLLQGALQGGIIGTLFLRTSPREYASA